MLVANLHKNTADFWILVSYYDLYRNSYILADNATQLFNTHTRKDRQSTLDKYMLNYC